MEYHYGYILDKKSNKVERNEGSKIKQKQLKNKKNIFEIIRSSALRLKVQKIISYNFMFHIYMLRCSFLMQVKCNWYRMGTIVLTVERKNWKTQLPEAASRHIIQKYYS